MATIHPDVWQEAKRALGLAEIPDDELTVDLIKLIEDYIKENYDKDVYIDEDDSV
ncbi:hypothetical protein SAMN02745148_01682 [Modicisalibacter ilicicola DSM 19980]|uniref:Uncharacterized protein n=1 Tax=Modicisalibacter ilicicola DSM 19980 TaxID=1121942 RepID=A0A1M4YDU8_9GAMM|nr:hypothetical protein [Halomonas ilicicola]SHF04004.1 hypothetical protein SAMN02745148_01682 [Halomonas ilicicola DSM 19980]